MFFWLKFAFRSCVRRRKRSAITLLGISFAIAAMVFLGAVMVGVNDTMVKNTVALRSGYVVAEHDAMNVSDAYKKVEIESGKITKAYPRLIMTGVFANGKESFPVSFRLINADKESDIVPYVKNIVSGSREGTLIGKKLADRLGVKINDELMFYIKNNAYKIKISGIFETGVDVIDSSLAYGSLKNAEKFYTESARIELAVFNVSVKAGEIRKKLSGDGYDVYGWRDKMPEVAQLVKLNEFAVHLVVVLVVAILGFGIANSLMLSIIDRHKHLAVMKAVGVLPSEIVISVVAEALIMCFSASVIGTILGCAAVLTASSAGIDISEYTSHNPHFSVDSVIYPRLTFAMVFLPQAGAVVSAMIAALWPAFSGAHKKVVEGLRYIG